MHMTNCSSIVNDLYCKLPFLSPWELFRLEAKCYKCFSFSHISLNSSRLIRRNLRFLVSFWHVLLNLQMSSSVCLIAFEFELKAIVM